MPIKIPNDLPASKILKEENIFVMDETRALSQRIRPLKLIIVNIMPTKIVTETQLLRLLSNTPLQIEVDWLCMESHNSKNTPQEHLMEFYKTFNEIKDNKYDGLIVTGAPVEKMKFEDVDYWDELTKIFNWANTHVFSSFFICWASQAALYYYHGVEKYELEESKAVGVIFCERENDLLKINPIVWVKSINTTFYETACGSGTIAVAILEAFQKKSSQSIDIIQPYGMIITAKVTYSNEKILKAVITGEVKNQGVIELEEGDRIADAIEKAGGQTEQASLKNVNLAYQLEDGQKIYIPNVNDNETEIIDDGASGVVDDTTANQTVVNINKADETELQSLNGIGESLATSIVQYRKENGKFETIEDLKNVPGIGDSKFENIKEYIKVK